MWQSPITFCQTCRMGNGKQDRHLIFDDVQILLLHDYIFANRKSLVCHKTTFHGRFPRGSWQIKGSIGDYFSVAEISSIAFSRIVTDALCNTYQIAPAKAHLTHCIRFKFRRLRFGQPEVNDLRGMCRYVRYVS
jgi:hypothetical protein